MTLQLWSHVGCNCGLLHTPILHVGAVPHTNTLQGNVTPRSHLYGAGATHLPPLQGNATSSVSVGLSTLLEEISSRE
jgi:hypothetical protein